MKLVEFMVMGIKIEFVCFGKFINWEGSYGSIFEFVEEFLVVFDYFCKVGSCGFC